MANHDDFYRRSNIIGYSGVLTDFPTVYFLSSSRWGHITQKHGTSQNVGRMKVGSRVGYSIGNEMIHGTLRLVEKLNGKIFHQSRSTLTEVPQTDGVILSTLETALTNYPNEKYITSYHAKDYAKINAAKAAAPSAVQLREMRNRLGI